MIKITPELANNLINYLATRPYQEVFQLISQMSLQIQASQKPPEEQGETVPAADAKKKAEDKK